MDSYIGTYLFDCLGMAPGAAVEHLRGSLISFAFRSFRQQVDRSYDPRFFRLADPEERVHGRVTFQTRDGVVTDVFYEDEVHGRLVKPVSWPPPPPRVVEPGEVYVIGPPVPFEGWRRRDIPVSPEFTYREPARGWKFLSIESVVVRDDPSWRAAHPPAPPPAPLPTIAPDFIELG